MKGRTPPPAVELNSASDLLVALWRQDALRVVLAWVEVLGTEVELFLTQLACNMAQSVVSS